MFKSKDNIFSKLVPQAAAFLKQLEFLNTPPVEQLPTEVARDNYEKLSRYQGGVPISMARTEDRVVMSSTRKTGIPVRIYWPTLQQLPLLIYFHGGGWSRGSLNTHDALCRRLAKEANCIIVSVDYRLAPEHPYPAAIEDAGVVYAWCQQTASALGANADQIAVGGDSAGGTISAALTSSLVETNSIVPKFQLLIYPSLDLTFKHESVKLFGDGFFLTKNSLDYYAANYAKNQNLKDWRISPLFYKKFNQLPPAVILTADCDPIRDDGMKYGEKLIHAGGQVAEKNVPGVIHAFMQMIETFPIQTAQSYSWISDQMRLLWKQ
ncbi:MAG: alpha/beta hydrolase [Alphaproteobacteria bacterium]|nr:alpha/beta hydrolase [Alphaproteobacteria bacterium]